MREFASLQLDVTDLSKEKILMANRAVIEAVASFRDVDFDSAHAIFGMSAESFELATQLQPRDIQRLSETRISVWKNRFELRNLPTSGAASAAPILDRQHLNDSLARSYDYVSETMWSSLGSYRQGKIRTANAMIVDAIASFNSVDDPAAHLLFDMSPEAFALTKRLQHIDRHALSDTVRPIWTIRFDLKPQQTPGTKPAAGQGEREYLVTTLLKNFKDIEIPR